ncbi:MAG: DNA primase [Firmicutes bacterium]|nr:DNA primase [Bacillota bacterium]
MATYIPPQIIDEIMSRIDIVELIGSYLPLINRGKNHVALCPFHNEDTPSFNVSKDKQIYYCFGCQKGGNAVNFVMEMEGLSYPEALRKLAAKVGVKVPEYTSYAAQAALAERQTMLRVHELSALFYQAKLADKDNVAAAYLLKRGIGDLVAQNFKLGYAPEGDWQALYDYLSKLDYTSELQEKAGLVSKSAKNGLYYDKFHGRLIFPITDYRGQVIAFGGRVLGSGEPKYLNSSQTMIYNKSAVLYGISQAGPAIRKANIAVIMEGYIDVITAHQHGVDNAVASLGTAFTADHARLLRRYTERVLLAYDGDSAGAKAALRSLDILRSQGLEIRILELPPGQDPDDFLRTEGRVGWEKLIARSAYDVLDYLLKQALVTHDAKSAFGKGAIVRELTSAIAKTKSLVERESFIAKLARELAVSPAIVYADLKKNGYSQVALSANTVIANTLTEPLAAKASDALLQLWRFAVEDKEFFVKARIELGEDFTVTAEQKELAALIENLGEGYDFQPSLLLNYISTENEGLRQYLLKLLQINVSVTEAQKWSTELITIVRADALQKRIEEISHALLKADSDGEIRRLLQEKQKLAEQKHLISE